MKLGTHIQTKAGLEYYHNLHNQFIRNKQDGMLEFFNEMMEQELARSDAEIERFVEDKGANRYYKMNEEDKDGWNWWKVQADCNSALRFFLRRGKYEAA